MSIADKLTLLINTKQDIKSAISEKGVEVTGGMTTYADAIRRIETGGGGSDSFYVPVGLKFKFDSYFFSPPSPKFALPYLILADGYSDGSYMFDGNVGLTNINSISTTNSSLTNCRYMFNGCKSLNSIPQFDSSNVNDMYGIFNSCESITTIPLLNTSRVTNANVMFQGCKSLVSIPRLDTARVQEMQYMFAGCENLVTIPQLYTLGVKYIGGMFRDCFKLKSLPELDFTNVLSASLMFSASKSSDVPTYPELTDLGGFFHIKVDLSGLDEAPNLTVQSLMNVINDLYDFGLNGSTTRTLTLGTTNLNKLTAEQKAVATNKGWVLK